MDPGHYIAPGAENALIGRNAELHHIAQSIADPRVHGVALVGDAGLGKSRLAFECMSLGEQAGFAVVKAVATPAAKQITLGALSHLLPRSGVDATSWSSLHGDLQPAHMLAMVQAGLLERATGRPLMLVIDDAHHLDTASAHLTHQLAATGTAFVVMTLRTGEEFPPSIPTMWKDQMVRRIDVGLLPAEHVVMLAENTLGGSLSIEAGRAIATAAAGNALFARELALGARESESLVQAESGEWRLTGALGDMPRLRDLVESRLTGLTDDQRRVLDLVALTEPIGAEFVQEMFSLDVLSALEQRGLLLVQQDNRRLDVRLTHPLYAEALASGPWTLRRRADVKAVAELVRRVGGRRSSDAVRIAGWELQAGGRADPDVLLRAAFGAHYSADDRLAEKLSTAGIAQLESGDERCWQFEFVLGATLARTGRYSEAEPVLNSALAACNILDAQARIKLAMAAGLAEFDTSQIAAMKILDDIVTSSDGVSPSILVDARMLKAVLLADDGRPAEALEILDSTDLANASPSVVIMRSLALAASLVAVGRCTDAIAAADQGLHDHLTFGDVSVTYHPASHFLYRINGLLEDGQTDQAWADADWLFNFGVDNDRQLTKAGASILKARIALRQGRAATAVRWSEQGLHHSRNMVSTDHHRWAIAACAAAHALSGDSVKASALLAQYDAIGRGGWFIGAPEITLARAWTARAAGRHDEALRVLETAAVDLRERSCYQMESLVIFEAQRIVATTDRSTRLNELAEILQGKTVRAAAVASSGLAKKDGKTLDEATVLWAECHSWLNATEAASKAADMHRKAGDRRRSTASSNRAAEFISKTERASSPDALVLEAYTPLTSREREIALRAAGGASSKSIASDLFLSARTVDNHLQRIYAKLGIVGRDELASSIGVG